ncbi:glutaredoxin family protein [Lederbergia citrea]|uniref:Glutaredoxin family protein n=1 Tax=Lederbergia citrea TaxID=2833581 RepID=A0A942UQ80_9BACI|nr:glutaredoxin family protein [Lederbergia citrea]MBS4205098.1 glutaredoxin family protein [Lederbergia citrea]MBS4223046.1 glutaredoxin family protein [Lederbergia citrea]
MEIIIYTRKQCPLCEDAIAIIQMLQKDHSFKIIEKDIETNDEWTEKYGIMIPVVEIKGEVIQYGIIDPVAIEERLRKHMN